MTPGDSEGTMVWRFGTVPYLNADPLSAALRRPDAEQIVGRPVELSAEPPSRLLQTLLEDRLDAALVSIGGVVAHPELRILPGMGIGSRGAVVSIRLYCARPIDRVRRVALDVSSRSAVVLTRLLFAEKWGRGPEFVTRPPDLDAMLQEADAALLIGNPALKALVAEADRTDRLAALDLGAEWESLTGLPFVYAAWAAPASRLSEELVRALERARDWGLPRREDLARRGARDLGIPEPLAVCYLHDAIRYELGEAEMLGMRCFVELGTRHGLLPPGSCVRMAEIVAAAAH